MDPTLMTFVSTSSAGRQMDERRPLGCFESIPASVYRSDLHAVGSRPWSLSNVVKT